MDDSDVEVVDSDVAVVDDAAVDVPSWAGHAPVVWEVELGSAV